MSEDLNVCTLVCRLGRDPEMRTLTDGGQVASLWVAVNGRKDDDTSWFAVSIFGKGAELAGQHLTKGRRIGVKGRLHSRSWETKDGEKRREVEVIAESFYFLDSRGEGGAAPADDLAGFKSAMGATETTVPSDEIPFGPSLI